MARGGVAKTWKGRPGSGLLGVGHWTVGGGVLGRVEVFACVLVVCRLKNFRGGQGLSWFWQSLGIAGRLRGGRFLAIDERPWGLFLPCAVGMRVRSPGQVRDEVRTPHPLNESKVEGKDWLVDHQRRIVAMVVGIPMSEKRTPRHTVGCVAGLLYSRRPGS